MEDGTSIPKKFGWEQASWRDKGSKNAYKRGGGCHKKGDYEIQRRNHRIEREREREREPCCIFLFLLIPYSSGKKFVYNKKSHFNAFWFSQLFELPIVEFVPCFNDKLIAQVIYLDHILNFYLCLRSRPPQ